MPENNGTCAIDCNVTEAPATSKLITTAKTTPLPKTANHTPRSQQPKEFETESLQSLDENTLDDAMWLDLSNHEGQYMDSLNEAEGGTTQKSTVSRSENLAQDLGSLSRFACMYSSFYSRYCLTP